MKRRTMDPAEYTDLKRKGTLALVEKTSEPQGMSLVNSFRATRSDPDDLVALAIEIQKADDFVKATTCSKLQAIVEQMRFLRAQALRTLEDARKTTALHRAACNFRKIPGHTYYLYQRQSGQQYFSVLSPKDWAGQGGPPHTYVGAYRLEHDQSWTPEEKMRGQAAHLAALERVVSASQDGLLSELMDLGEGHVIMDSS